MKLTDNSVSLEERVRHAEALAADPRPQALDELLAGLEVMSEDLRDAIVAALKKKKNVDALVLHRATDAARSATERVRALAGVRTLKPKAAASTIAPLLDPAKVKDEQVREAAAHALCVVDAQGAEAALVKSVQSEPSAKVRYFVALALGELKTPAARAAVASQLKIEKDLVVLDSLERSQRKQAAP